MELLPLLFPVLILVVISIRQVNQYERMVMFTFGKFTGIKEPGWRLVWPIIQTYRKVDIRVKALDLTDLEALTKDNIPVHLNAVIYFKVIDAGRAVLEVENFLYATMQLAQTTMRTAVGEVTLDNLLQKREDVANRTRTSVDQVTDQWGIDIQNIELKDIQLPDSLKRTLAKVAEAERERQAVIIQAEGEVMAAENITKAANMLASAPGGLHLRTLQSINDISSDDSNTTVWMVPVEALKALEGIAQAGKKIAGGK